MISVRNRLIAMIMGVLLLCFTLVSFGTYHYSHEELGDMLDGSLKQVAFTASGYGKGAEYRIISNKPSLEEEEEYLIQVWERGRLIYSSHPLIKVPLMNSHGFGDVELDSGGLRYFQYSIDDRIIQAMQSLEERQEMENELFGFFLVPLFIQIPIMMGLVYVVIGQGLKPLFHVSNKVRERGAHNLSPIDISNIPQEVYPLIKSLNILLRRLEDSLKLQRQFTADAAHELRTPLTAIKLHIDLLERTEDEDERAEIENNLRAAIDRGSNLLQNLLLLARHEPESLAVGADQINIYSVAKKVCHDLMPLADDRSQILEFIPNTKEAYIEAQIDNVIILIENLVQNALLYTQDGGRVRVTLTEKSDHIELSVADNGPGIKEEDRIRVFDRFYRSPGTKKIGSGLGLSIVKNIVEYYQGNIRIEDGLDEKGSNFILTFPLNS